MLTSDFYLTVLVSCLGCVGLKVLGLEGKGALVGGENLFLVFEGLVEGGEGGL